MYKMNHIGVLLLTFFSLAASKRQANIVFILTDDQDLILGGMTPLKKVEKLIGEEGVTFTNAFATTPICCPSRCSILTGLYLHSHGTVNNSVAGGCSSLNWQKVFEPRTFGNLLHDAGYKTFFAGKYLNKYGMKSAGGVEHVPVGWDWWVGLVGNSAYYNYNLSVNGSRVYKGEDESDYLTDVLKDYSLMFLNEGDVQKKPFLMVINPPSPHEPFTPANRHKGRFKGTKAPRTASFNIPATDSKHWLLRLPPEELPPDVVDAIDIIYQSRWESLLAVDELVEAVVDRLLKLRLLDNTYIIFSSDHGFHLGQFAQPWDKRQPYETDIRVPLLMRGPNIYKNVINHPVLNVDIAPTILDMAGVKSKHPVEGESFLRYVNEIPASQPSRTFLVEYRGEHGSEEDKECYQDPDVKLCHVAASCKCFDARNNTYTCVRRLAEDWNDIYCEFEDGESFVESYDLKVDPNQMSNLAGRGADTARKNVLECCKKMMEKKLTLDECLN